MTFFTPKVSIIIPVYNGANFMREAINSALAQTYENIEVIVINDGSNDNGITEKIALSYGNKIRYFSKENGGVASALNLGVEKMTGEYFSWLSHDDMYHPQKIEKQISSIQNDQSYSSISVCNVTVINETGKEIKTNLIAERAKRSVRCFLAIDTDTGINGCALLIPKELFDRCGPFNINLKTTQDYDMWFRMTYHARFTFIPDALVFSRSHDAQGGRTMGNLPTLEADQLHSSMISKIELSEMKTFILEDLEYLENIYNVYKNAGYIKTAAYILARIFELYVEKKDIDRVSTLMQHFFLRKEITQNGDAKKIINSSISTKKQGIKPTILIYCYVWIKGGLERVISTLIEELNYKYNFVLVSIASEDNAIGYPLPEECTHIKIRSELTSDLSFVLLSLAQLTHSSLVIINPNILTEVIEVYPTLKECGVKTIACNHNDYFLPTWSDWLYPIMTKRLSLLKEASVVTWLTSFSANVYALQNKNGALMPNPNSFNTSAGCRHHDNGKVILCVGRFDDAIKRLDRALNVFKLIYDQRSDVQLVLVGKYNLDQKITSTSHDTLRELINSLNLPQDSVIFMGEQTDVTPYYQEASVFMMTSEHEGFGLVLTEAGSFGTPCVIFEIPGLEDIITDGENGYIIPQDDLKGMSEKIVYLLSNNELRKSMGQKAWAMSQRFSRKEVCNRWSDLIDLVLSTVDEQELKSILNEKFSTPPSDMLQFAEIIAREYENGIKTIVQNIEQKNSCSTSFEKQNVSNSFNMNDVHIETVSQTSSNIFFRTLQFIKQNGLKKTIIKIITKIKNAS